MSKALDTVNRTRDAIDPRWGDGQVALALALLHRARRRRVVTRAALLVTAGLLAVAVVASEVRKGPEAVTPAVLEVRPPVAVLAAPSPTAASASQLKLDGEATVTLLNASTELALRQHSPRWVSVELRRGAGRFTVTHADRRTFQVQVGDVSFEVLGTVFAIARGADAAELTVDQGQVLVRWLGQSRVIKAGESASFPITVPEADTVAPLPPEESPEQPVKAPAVSRSSWQGHARTGDFARAYGELQKGDRPKTLADLLLAADAARLSGHPREAVPYLERVIREYPADARAGLASFTLGRVSLNDLHEPTKAANAFARARALEPSGSLAEDALARETEAWSKANDPARARTAAQTYQRLYPSGRYVDAVRAWGGPP